MDKKYDVLKLSNQLCFPLYAAAREVVKRYRPHLDEIGLLPQACNMSEFVL